MFSKSRGPRVYYVAASARELPDEVQNWLGQAEHRAARSASIYDALALLACGARPAALIVSIEAVDWSEMDFFDQAARLSRGAHLYAVGRDARADKLQAAYRRGALPFDEAALNDDAASPQPWSRGTGVSDILAARLEPASALQVTPLRAAPPMSPSGAPGLTGLQAAVAPVRPAESLRAVSTPEPDEAFSESEPDPEVEPPPVRLVSRPEANETEGAEPIPFPWAPSQKRPQRTPPKVEAAADEQPPAVMAASVGMSAAGRPVELTSEELSALMGKPTGSDSATGESRT